MNKSKLPDLTWLTLVLIACLAFVFFIIYSSPLYPSWSQTATGSLLVPIIILSFYNFVVGKTLSKVIASIILFIVVAFYGLIILLAISAFRG